MADIITEVVDEAEALVHDAEELYPPKPGGIVDQHLKRKAAEEAAREAGSTSDVAEIGRNKVRAVRTVPQAAELATATTVVVGTANPRQQVLGRDVHRKRAVITALDAPVVLAYSLAAAGDPQNAASAVGQRASGVVLPVGQPYAIEHQGEVYAVAISGAAYTAAGPQASTYAYAAVTSPAAYGNIVNITGLPSGIYSIGWTAELEGTVSATDVDNFRLVVNGTLVGKGLSAGVTGIYPQQAVQVAVTTGSISVQTTGAGTVGAVYSAQLVVTGLAVTVTSARVSVSTEIYDPS